MFHPIQTSSSQSRHADASSRGTMSDEVKELLLIANMNTVLSRFHSKTLSAVSMDEETTQCPVFSFTDGTAFHLDHQWSGRWYKGSQSWKGVEELKAFCRASSLLPPSLLLKASSLQMHRFGARKCGWRAAAAVSPSSSP
jgi:hypothetical protein